MFSSSSTTRIFFIETPPASAVPAKPAHRVRPPYLALLFLARGFPPPGIECGADPHPRENARYHEIDQILDGGGAVVEARAGREDLRPGAGQGQHIFQVDGGKRGRV